MKSSLWVRAFVAAVALLGAVAAQAQTVAAGGSIIVIPLVTHSASFKATIFVRNDQATDITLNVRFYDTLLAPPPGQRACSQLVVPASQTVSFTLDAQCTFNPANSHFGMLVLEDATALAPHDYKTNFFHAFARSQNPLGIGLSVEGFPIGNFSGQNANVLGLERVAAAPGYQSNCFVAALGEAVDYTLKLFDGTTNTQIGSTLSGSLVPYQTVRFSDVFTAVGAPAGDHTNARARFSSTDTDPNAPSLVGYCTVQENNTFGADFRIAKSRDGLDRRQKRFMCYATDPADATCQTTDPVAPTQIPSTSARNIHWLFIAQPDFVKCDLVSAHLADLEMRLRVADDVYNGNTVFTPTAPFNANPPYTAGGAGLTGFYIFTGHRSQIGTGPSAGQITRWFIDVQPSATGVANPADFPVDYGIVCTAGNGVSVPYFRAQAARAGF